MSDKGFSTVYKIQGGLVLSCLGIFGFIAPQHVLGFVSGYVLVTFEFYLLYLMWKRIFAKKPVAITMLLIITKYAVLGVVIYAIAKHGSAQLPAFCAGVTTLPASFLILALKVQFSEKKKNAL